MLRSENNEGEDHEARLLRTKKEEAQKSILGVLIVTMTCGVE